MLLQILFQWLTLAASPAAAPLVAGHDCAEAGRATIEAPERFDAVRVTTAPGEPGAAVRISVASGDRWSSVRAIEGGATTVSLDATSVAASATGQVTLAIEPDLDASVGACVETIELLRNGEVVGGFALGPAKR